MSWTTGHDDLLGGRTVPITDADDRIRSLAAMARALGRSEPLMDQIEVAAEQARVALRAATVSVSRLMPGSVTVRTLINVGDLGPTEQRWPDDETYTVEKFASLALISELKSWAHVRDDPAIPAGDAELLDQLGKGASMGAPLIVDGGLWGEFYATRHVGDAGFDDVDTAYLEALLAILAGAISRSLREESLEQLAYRDPLTGLLNRRALDEYAEQAFRVALGETGTVTAVTMDVNRLKEVNDTLGHVAGDQLIQAVAHDLDSAFKALPSALVARVGGDEFTVLVRGVDPVHVVAISDDLCRRTWRFGSGASVSAGAASVTLSCPVRTTPMQLFTAADRAQYVAKRGRLTSTVLSTDLDPDVDQPAVG